MALSPADLLIPLGSLDPAVLWAGLTSTSVEEKVQAYLDQAYVTAEDLEDADADRYARRWAEYRALDEVLHRRVMYPSSVDDKDEVAGSWNAEQLRLLERLRDEAKADAEAILVEVGIEEDEEYDTIQSLR